MVASKNFKHGHARTPEYDIWIGVKKRCENPKYKSFADYGGRGVTICPEWRDSFVAFLADVGPRPSPKHSIGRIDNDGNYEPGNVRWETSTEQASNTRRSVRINVDGVERTVAEWARLNGINPYTIYDRLDAGWDGARAVSEVPNK